MYFPVHSYCTNFGTISQDVLSFSINSRWKFRARVRQDHKPFIIKVGATLSVPTQKVWVERSKEKENELVKSTEEQVQKWREKGELYLPKFPDEEIEKLHSSIQYPPK